MLSNWAIIIYRCLINLVELSLNSYLGIFFIILGLLVRVDFKIGMQKDLP